MNRKKPVLLAILDGFAMREEKQGNAVALAQTPNFDRYWNQFPHTLLEASGGAVGLPEGQMGNSEVGHLNIGAGRVVYQDLTRITKAISDGSFARNETLLQAIDRVKKQESQLHLIGLLSDGGVHSHIDHLFALLELVAAQGLQKVFVHAFLDGRDVAPDNATLYLEQLQAKMDALGIGQLATLHGRYYAMDRDRRWDRTEKSYRAMVEGIGILSQDPFKALNESYQNQLTDEFVLPTVLTDQAQKPVAQIQDRDAVIFFNFRPDRAIQLSQAFTQTDFTGFARSPLHPQSLTYVCLTHYHDSIQGRVAFPTIDLAQTFGEVVAAAGLRQLRIAETEKYPHVTFFFNGGKQTAYPQEERILIDSPKVTTYDLKPEMSAYPVTEALLQALEQDLFDTIILNFANPDMVGHSGKLDPTIRAVEAVDECLGQIVDTVLKKGGVAVITADHGNADQVIDEQNRPYTAHTTYPVPCIVTDSTVTLREKGILADIAPTLLDMLQIAQPDAMTGNTLLRRKINADDS